MTESKGIDKGDPFLGQYQPEDLRVASEFLATWLPFLSRNLCRRCTRKLSDRIRSLDSEVNGTPDVEIASHDNCCGGDDNNSVESIREGEGIDSIGSRREEENGFSRPLPAPSTCGLLGPPPATEARSSWADMAQEDELAEEMEQPSHRVVDVNTATGELRVTKVEERPKLSREQREYIRFMNVEREKEFVCLERVNGKPVNILEGLELHKGIFSAAEQRRIVDDVYRLQQMGREGKLKARTYTAPKKWLKGKGRITIQFGCCYNYGVDKNGNPPGILQNELVDPLPSLFKVMIRRLIQWHVLPPTCVPDSCIVNIYEEGDCIPPHIDNHDFVRPFCTVSFLSECNILFGTNLKPVNAGEFEGSYSIPLPLGSVLVLNGNGADLAKHCVPSVPTKRISITFRKMDDAKRPSWFVPEPDLQHIEPLSYEEDKTEMLNSPASEPRTKRHPSGNRSKAGTRNYVEGASQSYPRYSNRSRQGPANNLRIKVNLRT
ncbi:hypothetical protein Tsubulata_032328 [Turnera subulata]|uniref:Fe2OG dioxygenase domain-containing protein n=1 Tax=Turnera subulata TaxID=218843 RepID=A0A9Q0JEF8_9ROSI|nr:hypothetical protein Tsubulata_032328 [Turnera subulata]